MTQLIRDKIIEVLKTIYDPEIPINIWDLGLIYDITDIDANGAVRITMTLTSAWCPEAEAIPDTVKQAVEAIEEVALADVEVVFEPEWTPDKASDLARITMGWTED